MMGQPVKGDRDQLHGQTIDNLRNFYTTNYFGENMVIVGTGNVNHEQLVAEVEKQFNSVPKQTQGIITGTEKPVYIPALLFIRDDEMVNSNVGIFYDAPSAKHEDYYAFLLLKHMLGYYRINEHAEHINDSKKQYNALHTLLGDYVDITRADCHYFAYSDVGMFGNYFFGNEVFTRQMNFCGVHTPTMYSHYITDVEVFRGRNKLYNTLMGRTEKQYDLSKDIGR